MTEPRFCNDSAHVAFGNGLLLGCAATLLLVKVFGFTELGWFFVLAPLWLPATITAGMYALVGATGVFIFAQGAFHRRRRRRNV